MRIDAIGRDLGRMFRALSVVIAGSTLVSVVWAEYYAVPGLLLAAAVPFGVGRLLTRRYAGADDPEKLHGMLIAAAGWLFVAAFGGLPFLFVAVTMRYGWFGAPPTNETVAAFLNPLHGFFESMSGFTGTGLTMAVHESDLPATLQWWRSLTEWIGGVGVIVLTTAVLARPGSGSLTLYDSESRSEKIHPSVVSTVRTIWWIFLLFTFVSICLLWLAGMPLWDAVNHAMTGLSTGGFSVTDASIEAYHSAVIDFALVPVMLLGSIAFPVHYLVLRGDLRTLYTDLQTRWVFGFCGLGTVLLTATLYANGSYATGRLPLLGRDVVLTGTAATLFQSFRIALFQFVSAASCTGFQTAGTLGSTWSPESLTVVSLGMYVGGAAGSTVGGIKLVRAATLVKGTRYRIGNVFYPASAVRHFDLDGRTLSTEEAAQEFEEAAIIAFLWLVFLVVGAFVLLVTLPATWTLADVLFEVASAQGNVGLSTGITGPSMPTPTKVVFLFNMWIGRLEIIPVLVLLRSLFTELGVYE